MPIRVTCRGCHTRFNVSDRFAGKEGPCPKCKAIIKIPAATEEVVVHAPADVGPKDVTGKSLSKPIFRQETEVTPLIWTIVIGTIVTFLVLAVVLRFQISDKANFPIWVTACAALAVAVPAVYGAYAVLRDSELAAFKGRDLWIRVAICAALYAVLWGAMPLAEYATRSYDTLSWTLALLTMLGIGAFAATLAFDFEFLIGLVHYGLYLGGTLVLRWIAGIGWLPGQLPAKLPSPPLPTETGVPTQLSAWVPHLTEIWSWWV